MPFACINIVQWSRKNAEVLQMIYLKFICNTSAFFLAPSKIFYMQVAHLYLPDFITDATVDLLTNNLKSWGWLFYSFDNKMSHWHILQLLQEFIWKQSKIERVQWCVTFYSWSFWGSARGGGISEEGSRKREPGAWHPGAGSTGSGSPQKGWEQGANGDNRSSAIIGPQLVNRDVFTYTVMQISDLVSTLLQEYICRDLVYTKCINVTFIYSDRASIRSVSIDRLTDVHVHSVTRDHTDAEKTTASPVFVDVTPLNRCSKLRTTRLK
jgi:hypothetical protein